MLHPFPAFYAFPFRAKPGKAGKHNRSLLNARPRQWMRSIPATFVIKTDTLTIPFTVWLPLTQ